MPYKTELCAHHYDWRGTGYEGCENGKECRFAHEVAELSLNVETITNNIKYYKMNECDSFLKCGYCNRGIKCTYKHPPTREQIEECYRRNARKKRESDRLEDLQARPRREKRSRYDSYEPGEIIETKRIKYSDYYSNERAQIEEARAQLAEERAQLIEESIRFNEERIQFAREKRKIAEKNSLAAEDFLNSISRR